MRRITEGRDIESAVMIAYYAHKRGDRARALITYEARHLLNLNRDRRYLSQPQHAVHNHFQSAGFWGARARVTHPGDDHANYSPAYADPVKKGRRHDRQDHSEQERPEGGDCRSPANDAPGLARLEDHRHLFERRGIADAGEEKY